MIYPVYTVRSMSIAMRLNEGRVKVHDVATGEVDDGRSPTRARWSIARAVAVNPHRDVTRFRKCNVRYRRMRSLATLRPWNIEASAAALLIELNSDIVAAFA